MKNRALKWAINFVFLACLLAGTVYVLMDMTGQYFRATGLELKQTNLTVAATWDDVDCSEYQVTVFDGKKKIEEATVKGEHYVAENLDPKKEYEFKVVARNDEGETSIDDTASIETKDMQTMEVSSSVGEVHQEKSFKLSAKAEGKVHYKSADKKVASVNKKGKVKLKNAGTTEITVTAAETAEKASTETVVKVTVDEPYDGEIPELQNGIASTAKRLAWPYGTPKSVYKYGGGNPTSYFKEAISAVYPKHMRWQRQCRWGASCDVFVGTVVRASGYDSHFPRGLDEDYSYLPHSSKFKKVSASQIQSGDIMLRRGHIQIYVEDDNGTGYIANAHYKLKTYGIIEKRHPRLGGYAIYHPTGECTAPITKGDKGNNVEQAQEFLEWAGYYSHKADGKYGSGTEKAVKAFQKAKGLEETGKFDSNTIKQAKEYTINRVEIGE